MMYSVLDGCFNLSKQFTDCRSTRLGVSSIQRVNAFGVVLRLIKLVQIHVSRHVEQRFRKEIYSTPCETLIGELIHG